MKTTPFSLAVCAAFLGSAALQAHASESAALCHNIVKADIVAFEQAFLVNRFSAFVPAGVMYALKSDVVSTAVERHVERTPGLLVPGQVRLREDKRPRPLVLRVDKGDCLQVTFTNLLSPVRTEEGGLPPANGGKLPAFHRPPTDGVAENVLVPAAKVSVDAPKTRSASFHVTGLSVLPIAPADCPLDAVCGGDGSNVGLPGQQGVVFNPATSQATKDAFKNMGSLAAPGRTHVALWRADSEGAFFAHSNGATVGGEGDGGQISQGLFGAVMVEPENSRWFRSQVTHRELRDAAGPDAPGSHRYGRLDYGKFAMLDANNNIIHSDLNAIVVPDESKTGPNTEYCKGGHSTNSCGRPYREFTVIFHDEVEVEQAYPELAAEDNPLAQVRDNMGVNYGVSSMGSAVMGTAAFKKVGPAKNCPECRGEEFFLTSWANGDPALILSYDDAGKPNGAQYPDDPSNVHHSYLGDPVRFRNLHAGPKETHVFHLHDHQWVQDMANPHASYLDSQTISPGASFSYDIAFGGSGNRNFAPGDSIFHCHLYPHFAQGMWELWRVHDAFADGKPGLFDPKKPAGPDNDPSFMNLPDAEIAGGTQTPALVPIPGSALAPMPTLAFRGFPFYVAGEPGHRPPQPPLDMDVADRRWKPTGGEPAPESVVDGGLPRHVVTSGIVARFAHHELHEEALEKGGEAARVIAHRVADLDQQSTALALRWDKKDDEKFALKFLPHGGEESEKRAMQFHEGTLDIAGAKRVDVDPKNKDWWPSRRAYETASAPIIPGLQQHASKPYFYVNGQPRAAGAPFADPCPQEAPLRDYHAAFIQTELTYNKHGWFDPQGRIVILEHDIKDIIDPDTRTRIPEPLFFRANSGECINFKSSNFVPGALNADDFQIYTPTDTIGQHIHLVKFDVTSSDGSGNGFNYEDATFSPDEVRERIFAFNRTRKPGEAKLAPKPHPLFQRGGDIYESAQREPERFGALLKKGQCPEQGALSDEEYEKTLSRDHPFCGAQRTTQRWWADPILNAATSKDDTLRTVFTHDHMGPSSHQQHGLYAGLVIEPGNSVWARLGAKVTKDEIGYAGRHSLNCDRGAGDPRRSPICDKLIGGSNLALKTAPELLESADPHPISGRIEPRAPLELRGDGGPTATFANILAPECIGDSDSNPVQPPDGRNDPVVENCPAERKAHDTRREFMLALADFGIAYNMALEPINPEPRGDSSILRDTERRRFGQRHVALALPRPLGISSEDPGSQYFNYRNEPVALRISEGKAIDALGGWDYRQSNKRADLDPVSAVMHRSNGDITQPMPPARDCKVGAHDCIGDPANAFSTAVHLRRDIELATKPVSAKVSPAIRYYWRKPHNDDGEFWRSEERLDKVLAAVESWRRRFNCMLYKKDLLGEKEGCADNIERLEPWRVFGDPATPIIVGYEGDPVQVRLIQGAQEAQHVFTMNGMKWLRLPGDRDENNSGFVNTQALGISEHFEFDLRLPKTELPHTDYLYFGSSVDQLWDGLWGIMRSYLPAPDQNVFTPMARRFSPSWDKIFDLRDFLEPLPSESKARTAARQNEREELAERKAEKDKHPDLCIDPQDENARIAGRYFDVSAVRVCDLMHDIDGDCANDDTPGKLRKYSAGLRYSERHDIHDERAIIYVLNDEGNCASTKACKDPTRAWRKKTNHDALEAMRAEFKAGRVIEPLVLRAAAGACVHVNLRNLLPAKLDDGPSFDPSGNPRRIDDARAYHNFLPMIADGFNINQFRMGNAVGLSAPRVTQHVAFTDGSNVGLNGPVVAGKEIKESLENEEAFRARKAKVDAMDVSSAAGRKAKDEANKALYKKLFEDLERGLLIDEGDYRHRQGSLASACVGDPSIDGKDESHCHFDYVWSLRDFREDKVRLKGAASAGEDYETIHPPVEYGALPLRSFGDAIKHPAHGLGGALIVGPQGSQVCDHDHNRFARSIMAPDDKSSGGRRKIVVPGGISAEICEANGKRYVDHVLMVQDAVNAQQNGIPLPNLRGAEEPDDYGVKALNYKTEPLWARRGGDVSVAFEERNLDDFSKALSSDCATGIRALEKGHPCDPETPVLSANAGDRVRLNIVHPGGHTRQMSLALSGHAWNPYPWSNSSTTLDPNGAQSHVRQGVYNAFGPMMGVTLLVDAGGSGRTPMDYLFRSQASFLFDGGIWGLLRVQPEASDHPAATAP